MKSRFCEIMQILFSRVDSDGFGRVTAESCLNFDLARSDPNVITGRSELLETESNWRPSVAMNRPNGM